MRYDRIDGGGGRWSVVDEGEEKLEKREGGRKVTTSTAAGGVGNQHHTQKLLAIIQDGLKDCWYRYLIGSFRCDL